MGLFDAPSLSPQAAAKAYAPGAVPSVITGTHTRGYDRRLSIYNLKPSHLRKTRAKLAKARLGLDICRIGLDGDSTIAGEGAAPRSVNSIPARLQDMFVARGYPLAGTGAIMAYNGASGRDDRLTGTGWSQTTTTLSDLSVIDTPYTFNLNRPGTIVSIGYFSVGTAGVYEISIDGGAPETVNITANAGSYYTFNKTALPFTAHPVVITKKSGGNMRLANIRSTSATGVEVSSWGIGGSKVAAWTATASGFNDMNPIFGGALPASDLRIANHFLNDVTALTNLATFKTQWQTYITRVLATGAELILLANHRPGGSYLDTDAPYRAVMYELADENDLPLVDFGDRLGTYTQAQAQGHMADGLHAGPIGYFDEAQALFNVFGI